MLAGSREALLAFAVATSLAVVAASTVPSVLGRRGQASRVAIATLAWNVLIIVPIYVLGLLNMLYAGWLAASVCGLSTAWLAFAATRLGPRAAAAESARTLVAYVRLPFDAFVACVKDRSFAAFGVVIAVVLFVWATAQAALAPTWGDWDCLWYHEPMIGFSIQNHGFRAVSIDAFSQKVNGYPRLTEMSMLWFGIFHGRWAVDLLNPIMVPMLACATYTLTYDVGRDRSTAIGFGAVAASLPGVIRILPTTLVDVHALALLVTAVAFGLRRNLRLADAWVTAFAVALGLGSKTIMLVPGGLVCLLMIARLFASRRSLGSRGVALTLGGGALVVTSVLAATYLRNYVLFHSPLWPDRAIDIPWLGIHWPGNYTSFDDPRAPLPDQIPHGLQDQLKRLYSVPFSTNVGHAWQIADYGLGTPWALIPISVVTAFAIVADALASLRSRFVGSPEPEERGAARAQLWRLLFVLLPSLYLIPAFHVGRYHLLSLLVVCACVTWMGARFGARRMVEALVAAMIIGNTCTLAWNDRGWLRGPELLAQMANTPIPLRFHKVEFVPADRVETAMPREREIGPGDVVVFERIAYLALLWNDHYSNRVVWLEDVPNPLVGARRRHAEWIYAARGGWLDTAAGRPGSGWAFVGGLEIEGFGNIYRRVPSPSRTLPSPAPEDAERGGSATLPGAAPP